jgi:hypothetical protein
MRAVRTLVASADPLDQIPTYPRCTVAWRAPRPDGNLGDLRTNNTARVASGCCSTTDRTARTNPALPRPGRRKEIPGRVPITVGLTSQPTDARRTSIAVADSCKLIV